MGPIVAPRLVLRLVPRVVPFSATVALPFRCPKVVACGSLVWSSVWSPVWSSVWSQTGKQKGDHTRGPNGDQTYALQVTAFGKWIWTSRVRVLGGEPTDLKDSKQVALSSLLGITLLRCYFGAPVGSDPKLKLAERWSKVEGASGLTGGAERMDLLKYTIMGVNCCPFSNTRP